jgi:hypothetical protein
VAGAELVAVAELVVVAELVIVAWVQQPNYAQECYATGVPLKSPAHLSASECPFVYSTCNEHDY